MGSLSLRPGDSLTVPRTALSVGFIRFVSSTNATQATGFRLFPRWDSPPTEHASLSLVALCSKNDWTLGVRVNIALLGATGFVGSALLKEALDRGHTVTAVV